MLSTMSRKQSTIPPDHFFIVGAQRSGTTFLYRLLSEHPEIEMASPVRPEPKFFITDPLYERGIADYRTRYFSGEAGAWLWGEKSTSYCEREEAASRIAYTLPEAKVIFLLRNPIERAVSHYWFSVENGFERLPIADAFLGEEERRHNFDQSRVSVSPYAYLSRGRYVDHISMYENYFPAEQIKLLLFEELISSVKLLKQIYTFLHVSSDFAPNSFREETLVSAERASELEPDLYEYLVQYFSDSNDQLATQYGLNLERWWSIND